MRKNFRMATTSVQLTNSQFIVLEDIKDLEKAKSNAEILRRAFCFYVENKYPDLCEQISEEV